MAAALVPDALWSLIQTASPSFNAEAQGCPEKVPYLSEAP
jgi:hypothetical protein